MNEAPRDERPSDEGVVHEYDGIRELDNQLPRWWLFTLYGAIVFAVGYWFHYEVFRGGESAETAYAAEVAAEAAREAEKVRAAGVIDSASLAVLAKDPVTVSRGKEVFAQNCAVCHGPQGGGVIGPNLTDNYWLHGATAENIFGVVRDGVPAKGMPSWGPQLGLDRVQSVTAYVLTVRNSNVAGGKAPQGDPEAL